MSVRSIGNFLKYGSLVSVATLLSSKTILNEANNKKPSIYDDKVVELVYLEDKPSRLEAKVRELRIQTNNQVNEYKSLIQSYVEKFISFENSVQTTVVNLVPKDEVLLPNSLYVGISTLFGSILARNRFVLLRIASPITFGIASSYFLLPGTTQNVFNSLYDTYKKNQHLIIPSNASLPKAEEVKGTYTSPELDINASRGDNLPLEQTIKEVEAMYTTRGNPGVRPALERSEKA